MGIVIVASLAARVGDEPPVTMMSTLTHSTYAQGHGEEARIHETHEVGRERGETIEFFLSRPPLNDNVFPLNVTKLAQTLPEGLSAGRVCRREGAS